MGQFEFKVMLEHRLFSLPFCVPQLSLVSFISAGI